MLYALIVGINAYDRQILINGRHRFQELSGCVRDAQALHDWLTADQGANLSARLLLDQAAGKANIVAAFQDHLSKAQAGDTILFFYSGHGTVEYADPAVWREESDGRLEGLACYYDNGDSGKFILSDKELRYLLHSVSRPDVHIITLFDCCHSGDNTRSATDETFTRKQGPAVFDQRQWSDFIFSAALPREPFLWEEASKFLPEGRYISLAASESNEPAIEAWIQRERHGVFAFFLLEILRETAGHISYRELCNRIRNRIRYKYGQRVKIYTPPGHTDLQDTGFLQKSLSDDHGTVDYNAEAGEFRLNKGVLDRVRAGLTRVWVKDLQGKEYMGVIGDALLGHAQVLFDNAVKALLPQQSFSARIEGLADRALRVCMINKDLPDEAAQRLSDHLFSAENTAFLQAESDEKRADYSLLCWEGMLYCCKPGDWFRPVAMPVFEDNPGAAEALCAQLRQMAQWHWMLELRNHGANKMPADWMELEWRDHRDRPLAPNDHTLKIDLAAGPGDGYFTRLKITVRNNGPKDIYVQPVLMYDFGSMIEQIARPAGDQPIEPGHSVEVEVKLDPKQASLPYIPLGLDESVRLFNHPAGLGYIQWIVSLEPIESKQLDRKPLPTPDGLLQRTRGHDQAGKGIFATGPEAAGPPLPEDGWDAFTYTLEVKNPLYNSPDWKELEQYLQPEKGNPEFAHFMSGLYLEQKPGPTFLLIRRSDLDGLEKGIISDAILSGANFWANYRRNRRFLAMSRQFKDRPILLSEGDSWFQHPLLEDIIDHIGSYYPTYCLAAAGDTMRKYFDDGAVKKTAATLKPKALILSGGGNDILGEELPGYLLPFTDGDEGRQPERFFGPAFQKALNDIARMYRDLFRYFEKEHAGMQILVNSYDYPRPKRAGAGHLRNWLGRHFDDKNIRRDGDRRAAARFMIDAFNRELIAVAEEFPGQVHHVDLRGLVGDHQWDDEIHPNNSGFELVSAQFLKKLKDVVRKGN